MSLKASKVKITSGIEPGHVEVSIWSIKGARGIGIRYFGLALVVV